MPCESLLCFKVLIELKKKFKPVTWNMHIFLRPLNWLVHLSKWMESQLWNLKLSFTQIEFFTPCQMTIKEKNRKPISKAHFYPT